MPALEPGRIVELAIDNIAHGGRFVARHRESPDERGQVVFVPDTMPGERVRAQVVEVKRSFASAVALEVLKLYRGGMIDNAHRAGAYFGQRLREFRDHPLVGDVRSQGLLGAIELVSDKATKAKFPAGARIGPRLAEAGYRHGIIFRAFNDGTLGFAPPICISQDEIDLLIARVGATLAEVTNL